MNEAAELMAAEAGQIPPWFTKFQNAFTAANRVAGACEDVAQNIFEGFKRLGQNPQIINITSSGDPRARMLVWRGRELVSSGNFHQAVMVGEKVYDAYTGPAGIAWSEYAIALEHLGTLTYAVVQ